MLRELIAKVLWRNIETAKRTIVWWGGGEAHVRAKVVMSAQASFAVAARGSWLNSNLISDLQLVALLSNRGDYARGLVAETHRRLEDECADCAVNPVVHVRTADAGELDGDLDIAVVGDLGNWTLFEGYVVWLVEDDGKVLCVVRSEV